jgi:hypothetical protein
LRDKDVLWKVKKRNFRAKVSVGFRTDCVAKKKYLYEYFSSSVAGGGGLLGAQNLPITPLKTRQFKLNPYFS